MGDILLIINIIIGVLMTANMFILKDIKNDLNQNAQNFLKHVTNNEAHCSRDKFKVQHIGG